MADTVTLKLTKPIEAHGETLTELVLRPPTVAELRQCGSPVRMGQAGSWIPEFEPCAQLISQICAIPSPSVNNLATGDFTRAAIEIVGFTMPSASPETGKP